MIWWFELIWIDLKLLDTKQMAPRCATSFRSPAETWPGQSFWQALKKFVHDPAAGSCRIRSHAWFVLICSILNKDNKAARYQKIQKTLRDFACETLPERSRKLSQITSKAWALRSLTPCCILLHWTHDRDSSDRWSLWPWNYDHSDHSLEHGSILNNSLKFIDSGWLWIIQDDSGASF